MFVAHMENPAAERATEDERLRFDAARVETLYQFAKPAYVTTLVIAAIMIVVLWGPLTADVLVGWFALLTAGTLARVLLHWRFARTPPAQRDPAAWERRFVLGALAGGCLWAFAPLVLFPASEPLLQAVVVFVVIGSGLGAVGVYGASMPAFLAFITLPLGATIVQLALQPGRTYQLMAMMALVFGVVAFWVYRGIHRGFIELLRNRLANEQLMASLSASEGRLRDAIESCPEGMAVYDEHDRLVICNDAYARVYGAGRTAFELLGSGYLDIARTIYEVEAPDGAVHPGFEAWIDERIRRRRQEAGSLRVYRLRDGRWLQGRFIRTRAGGSVSLFTDISDIRRAEDAYLAVRAEEDLMLDTLPVGVAFLIDRRVSRCNATLERMLGYAPGELAGKSLRELCASEQGWVDAETACAQMADGGARQGDAALKCKDGSPLWMHIQARAMDPATPSSATIVTFSDLTARRSAERALARNEEMYRNLVETSNDLIWSLDAEGRWTYANAAAVRRIYGREAAELLGRPLRELIAPEVQERDVAVFRRVLKGEPVYSYETRHLHRDGRHVDLSFNAIPLRSACGEIVGSTGTARDVTEQKLAAAALHESVEKLRLAVDAADLYYWEWNVDADVLHWGRDPSVLIGRPDERTQAWPDLRSLLHPEDRERYAAAGRQALESGEAYRCEFRIITQDGETRWISSEGKLIRGGRHGARRMLGASRDVTDAKRQEEEVRFLAYHDTLTSLPNRRLLEDRLKQAVYLAQRRDARVGVMLIDLDEFKQVNDSLGHRAGDAVLREVSRRLAGCVRKADTLARQGGDEFIVVIPDLALESDCQVVAEKILRALEPECMVDGRAFRIGASIGISVFPADASDGEGLLRNADVAMYRAKQLGRNNYRFYSR
ncbi:MAG: PAS domain S-box protein [Betaproteobacteria bacterium]|nr:PAS domain S-box protein [Betaproteobacteria bacterium]